MRKQYTGLYHSLVILPDRVFPFKTKVQGQWVRGINSYNARLERYQRMYGRGHYGYRLGAYRQIFHFVGSILVLVLTAHLSQLFLGSNNGMYILLSVAVAFISFQEFYLHRRMYQQLWKKGFLDWFVWCAPLGIYLFAHFR